MTLDYLPKFRNSVLFQKIFRRYSYKGKADSKNSDLDFYLNEFNEKIKIPLFEDIRRTLEVTCHRPGKNNHGSNFTGNAVVLMGIETVSQFINEQTPEAREKFREEVTHFRNREFYEKVDSGYSKIGKNKFNKYLIPRDRPVKFEGSQLVKKFIEQYFDKSFMEYPACECHNDKPIRDIVWSYRNFHMHGFYPDQGLGVKWAYRAPTKLRLIFNKFAELKVGVSINQLEGKFINIKKERSWYMCENGVFSVCPQIVFIFLKEAVERFQADVKQSKQQEIIFLENIKHLSKQYQFKELPT